MSPDPFAQADEANAERAKLEALRRFERDRDAKRDHRPMPAGSLFDDVTRNQGSLF